MSSAFTSGRRAYGHCEPFESELLFVADVDGRLMRSQDREYFTCLLRCNRLDQVVTSHDATRLVPSFTRLKAAGTVGFNLDLSEKALGRWYWFTRDAGVPAGDFTVPACAECLPVTLARTRRCLTSARHRVPLHYNALFAWIWK